MTNQPPDPVSPIKKLLDEVKWEVVPKPADLEPGELYATHSGVMNIMGKTLRVHRLNNGQSIIDADDMAKLFGVQ